MRLLRDAPMRRYKCNRRPTFQAPVNCAIREPITNRHTLIEPKCGTKVKSISQPATILSITSEFCSRRTVSNDQLMRHEDRSATCAKICNDFPKFVRGV